MARKLVVSMVTAMAIGVGFAVVTLPVHADNIFSIMNPFRWFDDDDDHYYHRHHRYAPGYWGWGGPWAGWGYPPYYAYATAPREEVAKAAAPELPE